MKRLELLQQKLLEPKPSASTNFATSAIFYSSIKNKFVKFYVLMF